MKFGKVNNPGDINFFLPENHPSNKKILGGKALKKTKHQNHEQASPLLSKYFIEQLNARLSVNLKVPQLPDNGQNLTLF